MNGVFRERVEGAGATGRQALLHVDGGMLPPDAAQDPLDLHAMVLPVSGVPEDVAEELQRPSGVAVVHRALANLPLPAGRLPLFEATTAAAGAVLSHRA